MLRRINELANRKNNTQNYVTHQLVEETVEIPIFPPEIFAHIFQFVDLKDLKKNVIRVNKMFYDIVAEYHRDNLYAHAIKFDRWQQKEIKQLLKKENQFSATHRNIGFFNRPDLSRVGKMRHYTTLTTKIFVPTFICLIRIYRIYHQFFVTDPRMVQLQKTINFNKNVIRDLQNDPSATQQLIDNKIALGTALENQKAYIENLDLKLVYLSIAIAIIIMLSLIFNRGEIANRIQNQANQYQTSPVTQHMLDQLKMLMDEFQLLFSFQDFIAHHQIQVGVTPIHHFLNQVDASVEEVKNLSNELSNYLQQKRFSNQKFLKETDFIILNERKPGLAKYASNVVQFWSENNKKYSLIKEKAETKTEDLSIQFK